MIEYFTSYPLSLVSAIILISVLFFNLYLEFRYRNPTSEEIKKHTNLLKLSVWILLIAWIFLLIGWF